MRTAWSMSFTDRIGCLTKESMTSTMISFMVVPLFGVLLQPQFKARKKESTGLVYFLFESVGVKSFVEIVVDVLLERSHQGYSLVTVIFAKNVVSLHPIFIADELDDTED